MKPETQAILVADLGYGDAGKGSIVDYLVRTTGSHTVVRYNGGAQAAHNVITPGGRHHTFAQFGSGTFIPGTRTHLSRFMMLHPLAMLSEERHLRSLGVTDAFERLSIERQALVTTPFHQAANRIRELARGRGRHGSCGLGVGETMSDWLSYGNGVLFAGDLPERPTLVRKLEFLRDAKLAQLEPVLKDVGLDGAIRLELKPFHDSAFIQATADVFEAFAGRVQLVDSEFLGHLIRQGGVMVFEGAQGILLDEWYGFYPYNTWSTLTYKNALALLEENAFQGRVLRLGLLRGYATRHGAGPFMTESSSLTARLPDDHNTDNPWQQGFRVGHLDLLALRYALTVAGGADGLVVTNLDRMNVLDSWKACARYRPAQMSPVLERHFHLRKDEIVDIRLPADPTDLASQQQLTSLLSTVKPIYEEYPKGFGQYLAMIEISLALPIVLTSHGPSALGKTMRSLPHGFNHVDLQALPLSLNQLPV